MREIHFRAKNLDDWLEDKNSVKWFYGDLMHDGGESRCLFFQEDGSDMEVDPDTVGQFTGMYDNDGKEIYEGDILQNISFPEVYLPVNWYHGCWIVGNADSEEYNVLYDVLRDFKMLVVGNIHENPELLR